MMIEVQVDIQSSKEEIWEVISDIENSAEIISGIDKIEILDKPADGLVGLKWRETRTMFNNTATEIMWVTEAVENDFYKVRAESNGAVYISKMSIIEADDSSTLTMEFNAEAQTFTAKLMSATIGQLFKSSSVKTLQQDLVDIKTAVEKGATPPVL